MVKIEGLTFEDFSKKYAMTIDGLRLRIGKSSSDSLARRLYDDSLSGSVDINHLDITIRGFFNGSVSAQSMAERYVSTYKDC